MTEIAPPSDGGRCSRPPPVIAPPLARCNKPGSVLWGLRMGQADDDSAGAVALTPDGHALVVGELDVRPPRDGSSAFLAKIDAPSGRLVSEIELVSGTDVRMAGVAVSSDGMVAVAGAYNGTLRIGEPRARDAGDPTAFVMAFDGAGKPAWTWAGDREGFARPEVVAFDGCGGLLVAGTFKRMLIPGRVESLPSEGRDIFLLKFDPTGKLLWTRQMGGAGDQQIEAAAFTRDGRIVMVGHSYSGVLVAGSNTYRLDGGSVELVAELTDTGDLRWVKRAARREFQLFSATIARPEGDTVLVGQSGSGSSTTEILLQQVDVRGDLGWQRVYGHRDWGSRLPSGASLSPRGTLAVASTLSGSIRLGDHVLRSHGWNEPLPSRQIPPTDVLVGTFDGKGKPLRAWLLGDSSWQDARGIAWVEPNWGIVVGTFEGTIPLDEGRTLENAGRRDAFAIALCLE
ncbi:hypothetical protein BE21_51415 [Sorangium cellulosum]|uniref:Uncharacterized protein n=1 Tax=Sorangium cellulosum TaxID=56 RepID=A0A150TFL8_SORCE|nr:hypothetical protein BE21_51415 [Sorangium cellulosum]